MLGTFHSAKNMAKTHTIVVLLVFVIMFSYHVVEGGAYPEQVAFSRKELKPEHKLSIGGMSQSLGGQVSGATSAEGVSKNAEIADVKTTTTSTTTDTHRDVPVGLYRDIIIHNHKFNNP
uniref:Uncharacterized protein n=1 Tax=Avena sativa TaxID=4498 RepID=A0ACD5Z2Q3_AVESA